MENKELKAKTVSIIIKIFDIVFVVTCAVLKWLGIFKEISIQEICVVGAVIAAVFGDVSINTALDKFTVKKE